MKWSLPKKPPEGTIELARMDDGTVRLKLFAPSGSYQSISVRMDDAQRGKLIQRLQRFDDPADGGAERRSAPRRLT